MVTQAYTLVQQRIGQTCDLQEADIHADFLLEFGETFYVNGLLFLFAGIHRVIHFLCSDDNLCTYSVKESIKSLNTHTNFAFFLANPITLIM